MAFLSTKDNIEHSFETNNFETKINFFFFYITVNRFIALSMCEISHPNRKSFLS